MGDSPAPAAETDNQKATIPKKRRSRTVMALSAIAIIACICISLRRKIYPYWNDAMVVNFLAAWIPFVLSLLLAFVPEHEMTKGKKLAWRCSVIGIGFLWSAVLWHQQVVTDRAAKEDQERIVTKAVSESNRHSDEQIGNVRADLKGVKGDISNTTRNIATALNQSGINISKSIARVNKPSPAELAELKLASFLRLMALRHSPQLPLAQTKMAISLSI